MARCHYCRSSGVTLTRDHIIPRARAGVNDDFNIVYSCYPCNKRKADDWPTCDCPKCAKAVDNHLAMIEAIREWSPSWADQLTHMARTANPAATRRQTG